MATEVIGVSNTAVATTRAGLRVVLVDADFGAQDATRIVSQLPRRRGFKFGLLRRGDSDVSATDFLGSQATGRLLDELMQQNDPVIVDPLPLLQVAYATAAIQKAGRALVVGPHGSAIDNLREMRCRLEVIGVEALGYPYTEAPIRRGTVRPSGPSGDVLGKTSTP